MVVDRTAIYFVMDLHLGGDKYVDDDWTTHWQTHLDEMEVQYKVSRSYASS